MNTFTLIIVYTLSHINPPPLVAEFSSMKECRETARVMANYIADKPDARSISLVSCSAGSAKDVVLAKAEGDSLK